jgi:hypothetical protein
MAREFIPYEQALALKELGFDEECIATFTDSKLMVHGKQSLDSIKGSGLHNRHLGTSGRIITAPLYQQAFRWFREKYNFCYFIRGNNFDGYTYNIDNLGILRYKFEIEYRFTFRTYEEAELACLIKLIEITKTK